MEQSGWVTADYRDARYHGAILHTSTASFKHGPGILVFDDNTTVISQWELGQPTNKNTIVITPTFDIIDLKSDESSLKLSEDKHLRKIQSQ